MNVHRPGLLVHKTRKQACPNVVYDTHVATSNWNSLLVTRQAVLLLWAGMLCCCVGHWTAFRWAQLGKRYKSYKTTVVIWRLLTFTLHCCKYMLNFQEKKNDNVMIWSNEMEQIETDGRETLEKVHPTRYLQASCSLAQACNLAWCLPHAMCPPPLLPLQLCPTDRPSPALGVHPPLSNSLTLMHYLCCLSCNQGKQCSASSNYSK